MYKTEAHGNTRGITVLVKMVVTLANEFPLKFSRSLSIWEVSVVPVVKRVLKVINAEVLSEFLSGIKLIANPLRPLIHHDLKDKIRHCHSSAPVRSSSQDSVEPS